MKHQVRAIATTYQPHLGRAIALMAGIVALSLFLYGFFLLEAVAHTAHRAEAQGKIETLTSKLSNLEQQYLTQTSSMTLEKAQTLGFVPPQEVAVVYANKPAHALSLGVQY